MKKLIVFDMDGTLAPSKQPIDSEMGEHLVDLMRVAHAAVISGGDWPQFQAQLLAHLPESENLGVLSLLPTCGTKFFRYEQGWVEMYEEDFSAQERSQILDSLQQAIEQSDLKPTKLWGEQIEDRGSQITFSALGQQAPIEEKQKWDPDFSKRKQISQSLQPMIPTFSVKLGGTTSIDITRPGIDKAYGLKKLRDILKIPFDEMIYVGDALFPEETIILPLS